MRAAVIRRYGTPDHIQIEEVPTPTPTGREVRVRIEACGVNSWDWEYISGHPRILRLEGPLRPAHPILGCDVAGVVDAVGPDATRFAVGDAVWGDLSAAGWGGFAEYVCADESALSPRPEAMSPVEAAAIPQAATMALQGLELATLRPGEHVLFNGAGGGVGTFGIQIARAMGAAEVTAVDRGDKLSMLRDLGADHALDHARTSFTDRLAAYDVVLDVVMHRPPRVYARALKDGGRYVAVGGSLWRLAALMLSRPFHARRGRHLHVLPLKANRGLERLSELFAEGALEPVLDEVVPLERTADAIRRVAAGDVRGKLVVTPT